MQNRVVKRMIQTYRCTNIYMYIFARYTFKYRFNNVLSHQLYIMKNVWNAKMQLIFYLLRKMSGSVAEDMFPRFNLYKERQLMQDLTPCNFPEGLLRHHLVNPNCNYAGVA
jgi:hypothetical protein